MRAVARASGREAVEERRSRRTGDSARAAECARGGEPVQCIIIYAIHTRLDVRLPVRRDRLSTIGVL